MISWGQCVVVLALASLAASLPIDDNSEVRVKRSPVAGRMMMVRGGYTYDRPANSYNPQPAMASRYAAGCGMNCRQEQASDGQDNEAPAYGAPAQPEEEETVEDAPEEVPQERAPKPETPSKRRPTKDEDNKGRRTQGGSTYSNFFPMMFGNPGGIARNAGEGGQNPGLATAIANSFSTGKGAVASSHATAFGGAEPSQNQNKRNTPSRYRV